MAYSVFLVSWSIRIKPLAPKLLDVSSIVDTCMASPCNSQMIPAMKLCHLAGVYTELTGEENTLLADFGLARTFILSADEFVQSFCGTLAYLSYLVDRVDIRSMGLILYAMVTNQLPFFRVTLSDSFGRINSLSYVGNNRESSYESISTYIHETTSSTYRHGCLPIDTLGQQGRTRTPTTCHT
ncbi:hypothetical protein SeMB42_g03407 [Synchytrium endobioticum]|uniref:Protein kinase domain-containing protein n=1 Tax=Synchytrium endobioticum TaxID=286115 RepID=A0A507D745_9FUNG|nr:hypothetical protein SeLEV6574_g05222 [Synchytrium endobioticum]TPX47231.1 hypothetical protein SeMB42_g03407 [Synchytrium endobioticum]